MHIRHPNRPDIIVSARKWAVEHGYEDEDKHRQGLETSKPILALSGVLRWIVIEGRIVDALPVDCEGDEGRGDESGEDADQQRLRFQVVGLSSVEHLGDAELDALWNEGSHEEEHHAGQDVGGEDDHFGLEPLLELQKMVCRRFGDSARVDEVLADQTNRPQVQNHSEYCRNLDYLKIFRCCKLA